MMLFSYKCRKKYRIFYSKIYAYLYIARIATIVNDVYHCSGLKAVACRFLSHRVVRITVEIPFNVLQNILPRLTATPTITMRKIKRL